MKTPPEASVRKHTCNSRNLRQEDPSKLRVQPGLHKKSQASQGEALSRQEQKYNPQKANSTVVKTPGLSNPLKLDPISKTYYQQNSLLLESGSYS